MTTSVSFYSKYTSQSVAHWILQCSTVATCNLINRVQISTKQSLISINVVYLMAHAFTCLQIANSVTFQQTPQINSPRFTSFFYLLNIIIYWMQTKITDKKSSCLLLVTTIPLNVLHFTHLIYFIDKLFPKALCWAISWPFVWKLFRGDIKSCLLHFSAANSSSRGGTLLINGHGNVPLHGVAFSRQDWL